MTDYEKSIEEKWGYVLERVKKTISLMRAKKEVNDELQEATKRKEEIYMKKVAIYQQLIDLSGNPKELKLLRKYSKKATKEYADSIRTISEIEEILSGWDKKLENDFKYMDSFSDFKYEDYETLMNKCNKFIQEEWEPLVLFVLNHGILEEEREKIRIALCKKFEEGNFKLFEDSKVDLREEFINKWLLSAAYQYL